MPEKEVDIREEILNKEYRQWVDKKGIGAIYPAKFPEAYKDVAINAMDENGKRMCLDLLEYMTKHKVDVDCDYPGGKENFYYKGEWITKEQLFEKFL